nr:vomeronasal type-2 receptor 1 [Peromyscus maniculatus bairdii]
MWLCTLLPVLFGCLSGSAFSAPRAWLLPSQRPRFDRPGDVIVGGSFSIFDLSIGNLSEFTAPPSELVASGVSNWGYRVAQSFVFAIEEINRSAYLLPNVTLGFSIRNSGDTVHGALHETMSFLTGQEEPIPNYTCQHGSPQAALVGDTRSSLSVSMARLLGLYNFPQVSYSSSLPSLSDKIQFPSFLRTVTSDLTSCLAVTQLIIHFQWSWVIILAHDDDFGQQASSLATQELSTARVCIEYTLHVPSHESLEKIEQIVQKMQKSTARVVLVFLSSSNFELILYGLLDVPVSGQVWVSKNILHMVLTITVPGISQVLHSTFGLLYHSSRAIGFPEFLANLRPSQTPEDMFIKKFWEFTFDCTWPHQSSTMTEAIQLCSGNESLKNKQYPFPEVSKIDAAYTAVYSIAHGLQDMITHGHQHGKVTDSQDFKSWQLLQALRKVHFKTPDGNEIIFDANGDLVTKFDILQGQKTPEGVFHLVHVGMIDPQVSLGNKMKFHLMEDLHVPSSVCSESCLPGFSQVPRLGAPYCCFDCRPCPEGQFADQRGTNSNLGTPFKLYYISSSLLMAKNYKIISFRVWLNGSSVRVCLSPGASTSVVLIASFMQVVLCGVWLATSPPFPDRDMVSEPQHIVIQCQEGSGTIFFCVLGYLGLLAVGTFSVAFLARGLPDVFNETKFLTFSMLLFCSVWTAFLPLYHSARGKSTVAVEIFSILASTAGLLGGIFIPKCYIILLKPERNTPAWLRQGHQAQ